MKKLCLPILLCCTLSVLVPTWAASEETCLDCHAKVIAVSRGRYVHQPFLREQCSQCHIAGRTVDAPVRISSSALQKQQQEQVRWVLSTVNRDREHWIRLPEEQLAGGVFLRATDGRLRTPVEKVSLSGAGNISRLADDGQPPQLEKLRVTDVRRGISTTATLQWQTDEHTDSTIFYGVGNLDSVKSNHQLARQHSESLLGLEADQVYQYQVVSRDLFGNETRSAIGEFSTAASFWEQSPEYSSTSGFSARLALNWELFRFGSSMVLVVKSEQPFSLALGVDALVEDVNRQERAVVTGDQFSHPVLKSSLDTNISVCKDCHTGLREEYSHPIRVRATRGMQIPDEYPLLPDGRMSCMTCHDTHASDHEYRLRKSAKADLCRGCHQDY